MCNSALGLLSNLIIQATHRLPLRPYYNQMPHSDERNTNDIGDCNRINNIYVHHTWSTSNEQIMCIADFNSLPRAHISREIIQQTTNTARYLWPFFSSILERYTYGFIAQCRIKNWPATILDSLPCLSTLSLYSLTGWLAGLLDS